MTKMIIYKDYQVADVLLVIWDSSTSGRDMKAQTYREIMDL